MIISLCSAAPWHTQVSLRPALFIHQWIWTFGSESVVKFSCMWNITAGSSTVRLLRTLALNPSIVGAAAVERVFFMMEVVWLPSCCAHRYWTSGRLQRGVPSPAEGVSRVEGQEQEANWWRRRRRPEGSEVCHRLRSEEARYFSDFLCFDAARPAEEIRHMKPHDRTSLVQRLSTEGLRAESHPLNHLIWPTTGFQNKHHIITLDKNGIFISFYLSVGPQGVCPEKSVPTTNRVVDSGLRIEKNILLTPWPEYEKTDVP